MLTLLLLAAIVESAQAAPDSAPALRPVEQRLELQLGPAARAWSGSLVSTLEVRATTRRARLRLDGPVVSRVEMTDREGRVELAWGMDGDGLLLVETNRPVAPGRARLTVAFDGEWLAASPGVARDSAHARAWLERAEGIVFPAWPEHPATPWTLLVESPRGYAVRASGRNTEVTEAHGWKAWTFRTRRAVPGDSLRVTVRRSPRRAR